MTRKTYPALGRGPSVNSSRSSRLGYITGAYWLTASTSFANPAVTLARSASNTFAGIRPVDAPGFILAQFAGAAAATLVSRWLVPLLSEEAAAALMKHDN